MPHIRNVYIYNIYSARRLVRYATRHLIFDIQEEWCEAKRTVEPLRRGNNKALCIRY